MVCKIVRLGSPFFLCFITRQYVHLCTLLDFINVCLFVAVFVYRVQRCPSNPMWSTQAGSLASLAHPSSPLSVRFSSGDKKGGGNTRLLLGPFLVNYCEDFTLSQASILQHVYHNDTLNCHTQVRRDVIKKAVRKKLPTSIHLHTSP